MIIKNFFLSSSFSEKIPLNDLNSIKIEMITASFDVLRIYRLSHYSISLEIDARVPLGERKLNRIREKDI